MISRKEFKSCCGSKALIFTFDKSIRKTQIISFKENGFLVPDNYFNSGIFFVKKGSLIATCAYGTNNVNVRCSNDVTESEIDDFVKTFEKAIG